MSAIAYHEPYELPAGILAVGVHGVFFALLYFGFAWQAQPAGTMSVELWQSIPETVAAPSAPPAPPRIEEAVQPPQPEKIAEPEIVLPDKKKAETKPATAKPDKKKPVPRIVEGTQTGGAGRMAGSSITDQAAREQAGREAAVGRVVDEYTGRIVSKIRSNIVMPPSVPNDARAEFSVTLLPGGTVLNARLTKSSGNAAYDNAVERAILKSQPLPLPADVMMFSRFRELRLVFKPVE